MGRVGKGLKGDWERDYEPWRKGFDPFFAQQRSTPVKVLSWGPGESAPEYSKRVEICDDLAKDPNNSVFTPEQMIKEDPRFKGYGTLEAEEIQAADADVVICLVVENPRVTGAPVEMTQFDKHPAIAHKLRLLMPNSAAASRSLLYEASRRFPADQTFTYTRGQYSRCEDMRAKCRQWVDAVRIQKHLSRWRRGQS